MKNIKLLTATVVACCIFFSSCKKDTTFSKLNESEIAQKKSTQISTDVQAKLSNLRSTLPTGFEKRLEQNSALLLKIHPEYKDMVLRALNVIQPTPCDATGLPLTLWLNDQLADWDSDVIFFAVVTGMLDFPTYDALLFENSSDGQYFGVNGEYTHTITKTFKDLQRFWNIQSDDIVIVAMHGSMLRDREKVIRIDKILYGDDQATAEFYADLILQLLDEVPQYRNGDHPIFTFNSFAQSSFNFPPYGIIPSKIIMGDGIQEAFTAIGYGDVAPQAILAHEFGHQIQFQLGVFGDGSSPEATRRTELMADAYSSYYLSHARGASMQWKRVKQFLQVFFNIGDCSFTNTGHHGTPTQRMAAAEWAYHLADDAQKQGHILTSQEFTALFEAELPAILAQ